MRPGHHCGVHLSPVGERRANAAKKFLVDLGIASNRLFTISFGEEQPVDPGKGEEHWWKNRRCEFLVEAESR